MRNCFIFTRQRCPHPKASCKFCVLNPANDNSGEDSKKNEEKGMLDQIGVIPPEVPGVDNVVVDKKSDEFIDGI